MQTIVFATRKGGSGKSTLAIGLAIAAIQGGHTVRLIETDPQGTLSNWRRRRSEAEPSVETISEAGDVAQLLAMFARDGVTLAIIDTASGASHVTTAAIGAADLVLIPVRPSVADIESTAPTLRAVRACGRPFSFVLNQAAVRGQRTDSAAATLGEGGALEAAGLLAMPYIVMRNDHQDALGLGLSVSEYAQNGKSAEEIRALWTWVSQKLSPMPLVDEHGVIYHADARDTVPTIFPLPADESGDNDRDRPEPG
ncbi:ParA family protein [soil metagenome]